MARHYHWHSSRMLGNRLHHAATIDEGWAALLGWAAPALKCAARDQLLGWSPQLRHKRLHLLADNVRFLILPGSHRTSLASLVLAPDLKRLRADRLRRFGHPCHSCVRDPFGGRSFAALGQWAQGLGAEASGKLGSKGSTPPSEPTIRRVLQKIHPEVIDQHIARWLKEFIDCKGEAIAVHGKTPRRACDPGNNAPCITSSLASLAVDLLRLAGVRFIPTGFRHCAFLGEKVIRFIGLQP